MAWTTLRFRTLSQQGRWNRDTRLESDFDNKTSEKKLESSPDAEYASVAEWVWLE